MSKADAERWNQRYTSQRDQGPLNFDPDPLLIRHRSLFKADMRALDIASGVGQNSLWLASQGLRTTALDISTAGLNLLTHEAERRDLAICTIAADLDDWIWPVETYDVVVVLRFLNRALFDNIKACIFPGGLILYQTFGPAKLKTSPGFNPDFVLNHGELTEQFKDYKVIEQSDTDGNFATIVARKPPSAG